MKKLPELLCPAGTPEALDAAIQGGADAVYLGGALFNARMNAQNFGGDALRSAVLRAHSYGVKVYLTLNTLAYDRELPTFLEEAIHAQEAGVDALIVADFGGLSALRRVLPDMELHASTQMSGHNWESAKLLADAGVSRMVIARETSLSNLQSTVKNSPIEIEYFVHGALCVCHSGQCLFSSMVGGRSGNRGECAQPCRLPYQVGSATAYPLSLKDLSLAEHIPELIDSGVASLKIEGRMKSPEYVFSAAKLFRTLLDERRSATPAELANLAGIFSRNGFTDGYFTEKIDHSMMGIRSEADKDKTRMQSPFAGLTRKIPLHASVKIKKDHPMEMRLSDGIREISLAGATPFVAINAPMDEEAVKKSLSKFGNTPYEVSMQIELDAGLMIPVSKLNELRRLAVDAWIAENEPKARRILPYIPEKSAQGRNRERSARFYEANQITKEAVDFFEKIFLPLHKFLPPANGVILPPVIFDSDLDAVKAQLAEAKRKGAKYVLVGNLGHLALANESGLEILGDYRLNVYNSENVKALEALGVGQVILSPELTLPQMRDVAGNVTVIAYGRLPLMTLEKCIGKELADCSACNSGSLLLKDRRGITFPVLREWEHRSVIYNSLPTSMTDRQEELERFHITSRHFIFSVETPNEVNQVIFAEQFGAPVGDKVRRI